MKQSAVDATNVATSSPHNAIFFNAWSTLKGTKQSSGKKKGKKGEGNQIKQNLTDNVEGGIKKEKVKVTMKNLLGGSLDLSIPFNRTILEVAEATTCCP